MIKLHRLEKLTDTPYLNLYCADYENDKGKVKYYFGSKRSLDKMAINTKKVVSDSVRVLPYYYDEDGKLKVVIIKEFRYPVGQYVFTLPAGGIEAGESFEQAVKRELEEEIGASVICSRQAEKTSFISAGMFDEAITLFEAEVKLDKKTNLETSEIIETHIIDFENLEIMLSTENFCVQSRLFLRAFYYKTMLKRIKDTNE